MQDGQKRSNEGNHIKSKKNILTSCETGRKIREKTEKNMRKHGIKSRWKTSTVLPAAGEATNADEGEKAQYYCIRYGDV